MCLRRKPTPQLAEAARGCRRFLGFFAWYHGLALGGVAKIGQVQLAQPVLTLLWAALILGETITPLDARRRAGGARLRRRAPSARGRSADDERRRRGALDRHRHVGQRTVLPRRAHAARR